MRVVGTGCRQRALTPLLVEERGDRLPQRGPQLLVVGFEGRRAPQRGAYKALRSAFRR